MKVGDLELIAVPDGEAKLPPQYFQNADLSAHQNLIGPDGFIDIPIGCFLVRTGDQTVLIDAGFGPIKNDWVSCGELPAGLEVAGVKPEDIDLVLLTHLHSDHMGWVVQKGSAFFPNATVRFGSADWEHFVESSTRVDHIAEPMEVLRKSGRISMFESDETIAPGITTLQAPGHTPGHFCVVLSSQGERAFLLGDSITCPIQLEESEWTAMSDVDGQLARRTREALWRELEGTNDIAVAAHFPGLQFGRVMRGEGKRYFATS
jgi:glyoxylase-like metal-dependent hydrolase (beta-lactamase superfamily II)